jgi:hypothetical protein
MRVSGWIQWGVKNHRLVGGLEPWNFMTFHITVIENFFIPTDELHHFSEG